MMNRAHRRYGSPWAVRFWRCDVGLYSIFAGFRDLGHEVWYLEDSGAWPFDPILQTISADCTFNVNYLTKMMAEFGFGDRWIYRNPADLKFYGAGEAAARDLIKNGDLLINVSSAGWLSDYDYGVKHQMFIDGDPMFCQINLHDPKQADYNMRLRAHDSHFTFGLNIGKPNTLIPETGIKWKTTVQPIALDYWPFEKTAPRDEFTTVMNWSSYETKKWQNQLYGQKDLEFRKFQHLPKLTSQKLVIAMGGGVESHPPNEELKKSGWTILEASKALPDYLSYRDFLSHSKAEWSVAKHGYVASRSGWFSGRTACYLALSRPALVQETGWSNYLPYGEGLLKFETMEEIVAGIDSINRNYEKHRLAARAIAEKYFEAKKVCHDLLVQIGMA